MKRDVRGYSPEELNNMSDEQLAEIEKYLDDQINTAQAEIDDLTAKEINQDFKKDILGSNTNAIAAGAQGALQGASFGFSDELAAAGLAVKDTVDATMDAVNKQGMAGFNNVLSTYKQHYTNHHNLINEELKELEKDHPYIYNAADIAGSLGVGLLTGGTSLYSTAGKSLVGKLSLIAGEGFVHGAGRSNMETIGGRLAAGVEGAKSAAAWGGGMMGVGYAGQKAAGAIATKVGSNRFISFLSDSFKDFRGKVKDDTIEFADRMVNYTHADGKPVINALHTAEEALDSIKKAKMSTHDQLSMIYGEIDSKNIMSLDADYIHKRLISKIVDPIADFTDTQVGSGKLRNLQERVRRTITNDLTMPNPEQAKFRTEMIKKGFDINQIMDMETAFGITDRIPKEINISLLNRLKNDYFQEMKKVKRGNDGSALKSQAGYMEKAAFELVDIIDEEMKQAGVKLTSEGGDDVYKMWREASTKFKDLKSSEKLLDAKLKNNEGKNWITRGFKEHWGKMSVASVTSMALFGVPYGAVAAVAGSIGLLSQSSRMNKAAALGLSKISEAMKGNPDKYAKLAGKLAVAADVSSDAFYERLLEAGAEVDLSENKLDRTMDDVVARQDSLMTLADIYDPDISPMLRKAIANGDSSSVGKLLTSSDKLAPYLSKGLGWEGKALSDNDVKVVGDFINKLRPRERRQATLQFKKTQAIPQKLMTGEHPRGKEQVVQYEKAMNKITNPEY